MGTFVLNCYEVLFNWACIKGNTDSLSCFWTEGFVSSRVPELARARSLDTKPEVQKHDKVSLFPLIHAQLNKNSYQFNTNVPKKKQTNEKNERNDFDLKETSIDIS